LGLEQRLQAQAHGLRSKLCISTSSSWARRMLLL
jgi:hypothetical protein